MDYSSSRASAWSRRAAVSLGGIDWIIAAERVICWGDIDADGFAILDNLRAALAEHGVQVDSMLMDESARALYAHPGVTRDKCGAPLMPSTQRLPNLKPYEAQASQLRAMRHFAGSSRSAFQLRTLRLPCRRISAATPFRPGACSRLSAFTGHTSGRPSWVMVSPGERKQEAPQI